MSTNRRKVEYDIHGKDRTGPAIASAEKGFSGLATRAKAAFVAIGIAAGVAIGYLQRYGRAAIQFAASTITAWEGQQKAEKQFVAALGKNVENAAGILQDFAQHATNLQKVTPFGDEQIMAAAAVAMNLGVARDRIKEVATAAAGLTTKGLTLETAFTLIAKAANGNTATLSRYGISLGNASTDQEKFNELIKQGIDGFDKLTQATEQSSVETRAQVVKAYGEVKETIGGVIAEALNLQESLREIRDTLIRINEDGSIAAWSQAAAAGFKAATVAARAYLEVMEEITRGPRIGAGIIARQIVRAGEFIKAPIQTVKKYANPFAPMGVVEEVQQVLSEQRFGSGKGPVSERVKRGIRINQHIREAEAATQKANAERAAQQSTPEAASAPRPTVIEFTVNKGKAGERTLGLADLGAAQQGITRGGQTITATTAITNNFLSTSAAQAQESAAVSMAAGGQGGRGAADSTAILQQIADNTGKTAAGVAGVGVIAP